MQLMNRDADILRSDFGLCWGCFTFIQCYKGNKSCLFLSVKILYIIIIIRVRIRFIKMLISRIGVWTHSYLHGAVKLAGVLSAGFACTDTCAEVCGIQALVLEPPTDFQESQTRLSLLFPSASWEICCFFEFFIILFHPGFCHRAAA